MLIRGLASLGRWDGTTFINRSGALYSGDAISDLRTRKNTLSVWYYNTPVEEEDAIVALCLNRSSLDKFVYIAFEEAELDGSNITYEPVIGKSEDIIKEEVLGQHRDLTNLDYTQMGIIAEMIHSKVKSQQAITKSKKAVAELIVKAIKDAKVKYNNKNQVIVDSYELLGKDKPVEDLVPDFEIIKKLETDISELNTKILEMQVQKDTMSATLEELKDFKDSACKSKILGRLQFAAKLLFCPKYL